MTGRLKIKVSWARSLHFRIPRMHTHTRARTHRPRSDGPGPREGKQQLLQQQLLQQQQQRGRQQHNSSSEDEDATPNTGTIGTAITATAKSLTQAVSPGGHMRSGGWRSC
jgi:hypothetical protein